VTAEYPYPDSGTTPAESRYLDAQPVPYVLADTDDLVGCFIGSITSGKYTNAGSFTVTVDVPFDIIGDPTELMRSQGMMLVWEARKM
jgi:hypothetical protein